jgi:hypothetical protein
MRVEELMPRNALAAAVKMLWDKCCGALQGMLSMDGQVLATAGRRDRLTGTVGRRGHQYFETDFSPSRARGHLRSKP